MYLIYLYYICTTTDDSLVEQTIDDSGEQEVVPMKDRSTVSYQMCKYSDFGYQSSMGLSLGP